MSFNYFIPSRILFGKGQLSELHNQSLPGKKALIVTSAGTSVKKYGYLGRLEEELKKANVEFILFDKILPNPIKPHVMEGAKLARESGCDFIIGLGGGSSIDSAKSIAVMASNEGDYWDYVGGGSGKGMPVAVDPLPVVAITTTAGTGTEADPWTVITNDETNEKIGFGYDKTFPVLSIVDPDLMMTVPAHLTAYQGFDALFHSTEGYINVVANEMSDMYALKSIELLGKYLSKAVNDGSDEEAREKVALANTLAGMVESTSGCTSEHSLEHAMSAFHPDLPHGAGLIMVSREYYTFFAKSGACSQRMIDMAVALGKKDAKEPMDFVIALLELQKACGMDNLKMSEYGIEKSEMEALAKNARHTMGGLFACDPVKLSDKDVVEIYNKSYK
ncbi:iron-containing alcohol dehydrogenase [Ruminiclostridium papyrosolvens DSM 2782]|uniref:Iron-containing alcohol dehydrogenase n=1 Tax=Ruminiclostridium papyrosolvens DSM 2782 TaxID=588581 RepID=F1TBF0_9FIRM|nr:iron-containing alcohol dehydrogenase [Ruminiclostridium papyrosolvens]EGD48354.1 iron-containing alcohol dehydrogenase [Ruminiclostridium papyrosolvens DSM 2782]WES34142.1 iron-containing alcohol dehydrogenase [Ruminiclostridium papyrosolvens DSM 2782]